MKPGFSKLFNQLREIVIRYDEHSNENKLFYLSQLIQTKLPENHLLEKYNDILLFICAHPPNQKLFELAKSELHRISQLLKKLNLQTKEKWTNSGLAYTEIVSNFSYDLVRWMIDMGMQLGLHSFDESGEQFKTILKFTLPDIEKEITAIEDKNALLLKELKVTKKNILPFLVAEFERLKEQPIIRDFLFDELKLVFNFQLNNTAWSKSFNLVKVSNIFYHDQILKKFDHIELMNRSVQDAITLNKEKQKEIIRVCTLKLILLQRETEPVSYLDEKSLRFYELERGISIALFTMIPERQLPLESYVGYTLFRNGYPAAYGGAWILGKRALFGINVFDWFRGGESGYILCQLLRCYRQVFLIDYFEVEPYQYGLGNPEGIESGAFWFYYKYGFRPLDKSLEKLASKEQQKISKNKEYKTSHDILERFTESNVGLNLGTMIPMAMWQIRNRITAMIHTKFKDNRAEAEFECMSLLMRKTFFKRALDKHQLKVMTDVSLMCEAFQWNSENIYRILEQMVLEKPKDVYCYQKLVLKISPYIY